VEVVVEEPRVFAGLELLRRPLHDLAHLLTPVEPGHGDLIGGQEIGHAEVRLRGISHERERILGLAEKSAGLTVGQIAAAAAHDLGQHHKGRQVGAPPEQIRGHAAGMRRLDAAGEPAPGLHDLPAGVVHRGAVVVARAHEGKLVGDFGMLRQEFRDFEGVALRADRLEGAADLGRGVGLHVPEVHVRRPAEVEDRDARPLLAAVAHLPLARGAGVLRQREADGRQRAHVQEIPPACTRPAEDRPLPGPGDAKFEHAGCSVRYALLD
jgi:hypothetical protein